MRSIDYNPKDILKKRGLEDGGKVQQYIDSECLRLCEPKVPKRDNILILSGRTETVIGATGYETESRTMVVQAAGSTDRIDSVVLRLNDNIDFGAK